MDHHLLQESMKIKPIHLPVCVENWKFSLLNIHIAPWAALSLSQDSRGRHGGQTLHV